MTNRQQAIEKAKEELTPEQRDAVIQAQQMVKTYFRVGAGLGVLGGYGLVRMRSITGFKKAGVYFAGFVIGGQFGFIAGNLKAFKTFTEIPNGDAILAALKDEMEKKQNGPIYRKPSTNSGSSQSSIDVPFVKEGNNPYDMTTSTKVSHTSATTAVSQPSSQKPQAPENATQPKGWWGSWSSQLENKDSSQQPPQQNISRWEQLRKQSISESPSNKALQQQEQQRTQPNATEGQGFSRTREDFGRDPTAGSSNGRVNQYGDEI